MADQDFTKRTHALGAPVQSFGFNVQCYPKMRNEPNLRFLKVGLRKSLELSYLCNYFNHLTLSLLGNGRRTDDASCP